MLSLRPLLRSAPRAARCLSTQTVRTSIRNSQLVRPACKQFQACRGAAFSTSRARFASEGQVNDELAAKLESEISMEREIRDPSAYPEHLREYLDNSPFTLQDTPGKEEVIMTRTFGDEKIRITFSIDDVNNVDEDADQMQDSAMMDELDDPTDLPQSAQSGGANTKGAINTGRTSNGNFKIAPEDSVAPADRAELASDEDNEPGGEPSFPAHLFVTIERPGKGALQVEAIAQDGLIVIDNVYYFKDAKLADPTTGEHEFATRNVYTGPPFTNLDEDLQVIFEKYLDERGINTTMALFVPEYIDFKEQREYLTWLSEVKNFVE